MTSVLLVTCALVLGQAGGRPDLLLAPQLAEGMELVYRGWVTEEALAPGVSYHRAYKLENHVLVLAQKAQSWDVAVMTTLRLRDGLPEKGADARQAPASVRLELVEVYKTGRLLPRTCLTARVPLAGPPTLECGALVEFPPRRLGSDRSWEVSEESRPALVWHVVGPEACNGTACLKIVGRQQSANWDQPRADHTAWRRTETVWLLPHLGLAFRVERVLESRDPARSEPTYRQEVRYDLETRLQYPGKLLEDRRQEIAQARAFAEEAAPWLRQGGQFRQMLEGLHRKVTQHLERHPPTPYRQAILHLQRRMQSSGSNDLPTEQDPDPQVPLSATMRIGQRVPDFLTVDVSTRETARLYRHIGRPMLIFFYNPASRTGAEVLRFVQELAESHGNNLAILALAAGDMSLAVKQRSDLRLPFPVLEGRGLHLTFGVDALPRFAILDHKAYLRATFTGWGVQTPREIREELRRWPASE